MAGIEDNHEENSKEFPFIVNFRFEHEPPDFIKKGMERERTG